MSIDDESKESGKGKRKNMAIAVDGMRRLAPDGQRRSPNKRWLDYYKPENEFGCPTAKKVITEEDMSRYLEQLRLATRDATSQQQTTSPLGIRQTLTEGQDSSGHTLRTTPNPRKRSLDYEGAGRMECDDGDDDDCDYVESSAVCQSCIDAGPWKRFRLDGISSFPVCDNPSGANQLRHNFDASTSSLLHSTVASPTLVPPCARTHLSSIPEASGTTNEGKEKVTAANYDDDDEEEEEEGDGGGADKESPLSGRVWIAPEVQHLCTAQNALLPTAVLNEIKTQGMELVPYMGPKLLLNISQSDKDDESKKRFER